MTKIKKENKNIIYNFCDKLIQYRIKMMPTYICVSVTEVATSDITQGIGFSFRLVTVVARGCM